MDYESEYECLARELETARAEEALALHAYEQAKSARADLEARRKKVVRFLAGDRPFLFGHSYYSGGDMRGKGGTLNYVAKRGWSHQRRPTYSDKYRGEHEYLYAIELEDDEETIKRVAYIKTEIPRSHFSIPVKKKLCDLPEDPNWDEDTRKAVAAWKKELADLRRLLA